MNWESLKRGLKHIILSSPPPPHGQIGNFCEEQIKHFNINIKGSERKINLKTQVASCSRLNGDAESNYTLQGLNNAGNELFVSWVNLPETASPLHHKLPQLDLKGNCCYEWRFRSILQSQHCKP